MAAEEGQVISCLSHEHWTEHLNRGKETKKLVVVGFTASWCAPSRLISPVLAQYANRLPHVIFLNVDIDELKDVAKEWNIKGMPTFVLLKDGAEVERVVGARRDKLRGAINKHGSEVVVTA